MDAVARELALSHDQLLVTGTGEIAEDLAKGRHHRKVGERDRENAASLAMVCGYGWAAFSGAPQCPNPMITNRVRESQRLRIVVRRGGWS